MACSCSGCQIGTQGAGLCEEFSLAAVAQAASDAQLILRAVEHGQEVGVRGGDGVTSPRSASAVLTAAQPTGTARQAARTTAAATATRSRHEREVRNGAIMSGGTYRIMGA